MSALGNVAPLPFSRAGRSAQTVDGITKVPNRREREDRRTIRLVEKHALDLHALEDPREISAVIANRMGISEARVDRIMVGLIAEHRCARHTLKCAVMGAVSASDEAAADVWREERLNGFGKPVACETRRGRPEKGAA